MKRIKNDAVLDTNTSEAVCPRCDGRELMPLPLECDALVAWIKYFQLKHRWCKKREAQPT